MKNKLISLLLALTMAVSSLSSALVTAMADDISLDTPATEPVEVVLLTETDEMTEDASADDTIVEDSSMMEQPLLGGTPVTGADYDYTLFLGKNGLICKADSDGSPLVEETLNLSDFSGLSWDDTNNRWVMNNFEFYTSAGYGIIFETAITDKYYTELEVKGENTIECDDGTQNVYAAWFNKTGGQAQIKITGSGILHANAGSSSEGSSYGIYVKEGDITVDSDATIYANSGQQALYNNFAVFGDYGIFVNGALFATAGNRGDSTEYWWVHSYALASDYGDIIVSGECTASGVDSGAYAGYGKVQVTGEGELLMQSDGQAAVCSGIVVPSQKTKVLASLNQNGANASALDVSIDPSSFSVSFGGTTYETEQPKYIRISTPFVAKITECPSNTSLVGKKYGSVADAVKDAALCETTIELMDDVAETVSIQSFNKITLDLKGHMLRSSGINSVIANYGSLTIRDTADQPDPHFFVYSTSSAWTITDTSLNAIEISSITDETSDGTVIKIAGGCISGGLGTTDNFTSLGGGICNYGALTLESGYIVGNEAETGGGVYVYSDQASFTMTGGTIAGNKECGVRTCGPMKMSGGSVIYNIQESTDNTGGGIWVINTELTMSGNATVQYNRGTSGGGISLSSSTLTTTGGIVRYNHSSGDGGGILIDKDSTATISGTNVTFNTAEGSGGGIYLKGEPGCLVAGTRITMADGSLKNVENIRMGDVIRTFDHETGTVSTARVCSYYIGEDTRPTFTLHFSDGTALKLVALHDLLNRETLRYVDIREDNAESFIGSHFYNADSGCWVTLDSVTHDAEPCHYYALYTSKHMNCIAEGMLTLTDDAALQLNLFDLDDNLQYNPEKMQADIEKYGLLAYSDIPSEVPTITTQEYEDWNVKYMNIVVGKGLATWEQLGNSRLEGRAYETLSTEEDRSKNSFLTSVRELAFPVVMADEPAEKTASLTIGSNVTIQNNTVNSADNNFYIDDGKYIKIADCIANTIAGITMKTPGQFSINGVSGDTVYFFSDDNQYGVAYHKDGYLELRAHKHQWIYSLSGTDTIVASCTDSIGQCTETDIAVTVLASSTDYDGEVHGATLSADVLGSATDLAIVYQQKSGKSWVNMTNNATPTDAASYRACFTVGNITATKEYKINPKATGITLSDIQQDFVYCGEAFKPAVSVTDGEKVLVSGTDYIVSYSNNIHAGTGKVKVTLKGNYVGALEKSFDIAQKVVTATALDASSNSGAKDATLNYQVEGLVGNETLKGVTLTRQKGATPGIYSINILVDSSKNSDYDVQTISGLYTVHPYIKATVDGKTVGTYYTTYNTSVSVPNPVKKGYHFAGWYLDTDHTQSWNNTENLTVNRVLYAKWVEDVYTMTVTVSDDAVVTLKQGNGIVATATTINRVCTFTELPADTYIVNAENGNRGVSSSVEITTDTSLSLQLPLGNAAGVVEVKENTPDTFVAGLGELVDLYLPTGSDYIKIVLTVETMDEDLINPSETDAIKKMAGKQNIEYLDMGILKTVYSDTHQAKDISAITDTGAIVQAVTFAYPTSGKEITIYRYHDSNNNGIVDDGETIALQKLQGGTPADGTYSVGINTVTIYATKFSTYALAYTGSSKGNKGSTVTGSITSPDTSDTGILPYAILAGASMAGTGIIIGLKKRKELENQDA